MLKDWVGALAIEYATRTPSHRGKARALGIANRVLGPVRYATARGDMSYVRRARVPEHDLVEQLVASLCEGDAFVDIGANIGVHSLEASRRVGESGIVIACEPSWREYARLVEAVRWNGRQNVVPLRLAVGASAELLRMDTSSEHTGLNHVSVTGRELVLGLAGDDVVRPLVGARRVVLKIDVEGAEPLVVRGLQRVLASGRVASVLVETTPMFSARMGLDVAEIATTLGAHGFREVARQDAGAGEDVLYVA